MEDEEIRATIIPVTPFQQNCSLLWCARTNKGAVVDPGGDLDHVLGAVDEHGVALEKILVTHAHIDHAGAVAELAERLGLPIEGPHTEDTFWIERLEEQGAEFGISGARSFAPDR